MSVPSSTAWPITVGGEYDWVPRDERIFSRVTEFDGEHVSFKYVDRKDGELIGSSMRTVDKFRSEYQPLSPPIDVQAALVKALKDARLMIEQLYKNVCSDWQATAEDEQAVKRELDDIDEALALAGETGGEENEDA